MDKETQRIDMMHLLTNELKIDVEHIPDKPKNIKDLLQGNEQDEDVSLAEEDLSQTHKKLTDTIV